MRVGRRWDEEYEVAVLCEVLESTVPFIYSEDSGQGIRPRPRPRHHLTLNVLGLFIVFLRRRTDLTTNRSLVTVMIAKLWLLLVDNVAGPASRSLRQYWQRQKLFDLCHTRPGRCSSLSARSAA